MEESDRTFIRGNRNPERYGLSLRATCGGEPDPATIAAAAEMLQRPVFRQDNRGYECELIAAAIHPQRNRIAYVETRAKKPWWSSMVAVSIKVHLWESTGSDKSVDIRSYNPFFGCDVAHFEWVADTALLIYREKHDTYVCTAGSHWPPKFVEIEDRWMIRDGIVSYLGYKADTVRRIAVPGLEQLPPVSITDAEANGTLPPDPYAA